jgi:hypothetical protein
MKRILLCILACLLAHPAYAYRPFNSTDAAVAKGGEIELECGPLGYVVDADGRFLVVPSAILNFGLTDAWELVIEGRNFLLVPPVNAGRRDTLRETALSLKGVLRQGTLQEHNGPSVALEMGLRLPGVGVDPGFGASVTGRSGRCAIICRWIWDGALENRRVRTCGSSAPGSRGPFPSSHAVGRRPRDH